MNFDFLLTAHSHTRWLIVVIALVTLVVMAIGWITKMKYGAWHNRLLMLLNILLGFQFIMGVILIIMGMKDFTPERVRHAMEHATTMLVAIAIPGIAQARIRKLKTDQGKFMFGTLAIVVTALLIYVGVVVVNKFAWQL